LELSGYDETKFTKENAAYLESKGIDRSALNDEEETAQGSRLGKSK
jgi:hypothetical protein